MKVELDGRDRRTIIRTLREDIVRRKDIYNSGELTGASNKAKNDWWEEVSYMTELADRLEAL